MLLITDFLLTLSDRGKFIPMPRGQVTATPSTVPLFLKNPSGSFQEMELPSPVAVSDATGKYSLTLPWPSESNPSTTTWQITMPDGTIWAGTVPEGQVGPLTINTLKNTYAWTTVQTSTTTTVAPATPHPYFYLPDGWDTAWKAAKAAAATTPCWISMFGDSIFNGHGTASSYLKTVPELLIASILTATGAPRYADYWNTVCGPPFAGPADHPWSAMKNGAAASHWEAGFHKAQYTSLVSGLIFQTFTTPYACTAMDIVYVDWQAGANGWSYSIDGGAAVNVSNTGGGTPATTTVKKIAISGLANTTHTIDFLQVTSATAMILGVSTYKASAGIGMVRMNCDGAFSTEMMAATNYPADRCRLHMGVVPQSDAGSGKTFGFPHGPSLLILGLLANNATTGEPGTDLEQHYNRQISAVRSLSPNCSVLLHIPSYPYSVTSDCSSGYANQEAVRIYENEIYNVARYHGCAVLNTNWKWGQTPFAQGFLPNNDLHPKDAGHADMAATMATVL